MTMISDGFYSFEQRAVLDNKLAIARGHMASDGKTAAWHGTYTRLRWFFLRRLDDGGLLILDDQGNLASFAPDGSDGMSWKASTINVMFTTTAKDVAPISISPSLVVAAYAPDEIPEDAPGKFHIKPVADPTRVAAQRLKAMPTARVLTWAGPGRGEALDLSWVEPQQGPPSGDHFQDTFAGQTEWSQTVFPYYGFNPLLMEVSSDGDGYATPGTPEQNVAYSTNPGQTFLAPLIFAFPAGHSRDYVRSLDLSKQPNLPIGRVWVQKGTKSEVQQTSVLSSASERMNSLSVTMGLNAGMDSMFNVGVETSYSKKVGKQRSNESRYVVSRSVTVLGTTLFHGPSLHLSQGVLAWLSDYGYEIAEGKEVNWKRFVDAFGSHYLHAMTYGEMKYGETRLSLEAEKQSNTEELSIKAKAEGGAKKTPKGSLDAGYSKAMSQEFGTSVEEEDVEYYSIGGPGEEAVAIFYDMRPISELLSPIMLHYNALDDFKSLAPWLWTKGRASLEAHLRKQGLFGSRSDGLDKNYRPRLVELSIDSITLTSASGMQTDGFFLMGGFLYSAPSEKDKQVSFTEKEVAVPLGPIAVGGLTRDVVKQCMSCRMLVKGGDDGVATAKIRMTISATLGGMSMEAFANFQEDKSFTSTAKPSGRSKVLWTIKGTGGNSPKYPSSDFTLTIGLKWADFTAG